ncbi:hypothetical protein BDV93DRAFT_557460 [Ceratobasidium sp. AG-I]|nr:hypothetical protein BDV93DRAFT_557460 [Ceratobasidium sp. AG-I]
MPKALSPLRKKKPQYAKPVMRRRKEPVRQPSPTSLVHGLSGELSESGRLWWNKWIGEYFLGLKKSEGNPDGKKGWTRDKFVSEWWPDIMSDFDISDNDKRWFFDKTDIGTQIYSYVNNSSIRKSKGRQVKQEAPIKTRAYGHDDWRRENNEVYEAAIDEWRAGHKGEDPNFGKARSISSDAFKKLPAIEQKKYKDVARARLIAQNADRELTDPNQRLLYISGVKKSLDVLIKDASAKAGIQICALILYQKPNSTYKIERKISEELRAFGKTPAFANSMNALQLYVEDNAGKVEPTIPTPCVYPDYARGGYPAMPNYVGWKTEPLQGLIRHFVGGVNMFEGATLRPFWKEIAKSPREWIDPHRLPEGTIDMFDDPTQMEQPLVVTLVDYFLSCYTGALSEDRHFQFRLVPCGNTPIHPSESQETSRELVDRKNGKGAQWYLRFEQTVTKCHNPEGVEYSPGVHAFANFLITGNFHANANSAPPTEWHSLPVANSSIPDSMLGDTERERYLIMATLLPDSHKDRVVGMIRALDDHQRNIPAANSNGVYASEMSPPKLIPPTSRHAYTTESMWPDHSYFQPPPDASPNGTVYHFEKWQNDLRDNNILLHEPSGTLYGGNTGVVRVGRALLDLLLVFCAARRDFSPPEDAPTGCDISRFPVNEWERFIAWFDWWLASITDSASTLARTSDARRNGLSNSPTLQPEESQFGTPDPELVTTSSCSSAMLAPTTTNKRPRKKEGKGKAKAVCMAKPHDEDDEEAVSSAESEDNSDAQVDFGKLDVTSRGSEDEDEDEDYTSDLGAGNIGLDGYDPQPESEQQVQHDAAYDKLGLRLRYGFKGDNTYDNQTESVSIVQPTQPVSYASCTDATVFGRFATLPEYRPVAFHTAHALVRELATLDTACAITLKDFASYLSTNPSVPPVVVEDARRQAAEFPTDIQQLYELFFIRQAAWKRAETLAPVVFGYAQRMSLVLRKGLQLLVMAEKVIQRDIFPDPNLTAVDVAKAITHSKKRVTELRWTIQELMEFQMLATKWHAELQLARVDWELPTQTHKLIKLTQGFTDWADDAKELALHLRSKRRTAWAKVLDSPLEQRHLVSGMWYRFGCPHVREEPKGLRDELEHAASMVSRPSTHVQSVTVSETAENSLVLDSESGHEFPLIGLTAAPVLDTDSVALTPTTTTPAVTTTSTATASAVPTVALALAPFPLAPIANTLANSPAAGNTPATDNVSSASAPNAIVATAAPISESTVHSIVDNTQTHSTATPAIAPAVTPIIAPTAALAVALAVAPVTAPAMPTSTTGASAESASTAAPAVPAITSPLACVAASNQPASTSAATKPEPKRKRDELLTTDSVRRTSARQSAAAARNEPEAPRTRSAMRTTSQGAQAKAAITAGNRTSGQKRSR